MYKSNGRRYWILLIGLFSGAAILVKWLVGLFVFLIWGMDILLKLKSKRFIPEIIKFALSLIVCCAVFVPWQWYITHRFPAEAAYEYAFNRKHITEALEGHQGSPSFYLERFPQLFGEVIFLLIFPGIYLYARSSARNRELFIPVWTALLFVLCFFSFVVASKVISHVFFIAPFLMICMGYSLDWIISRIRVKSISVLLLIVVGILSCKPEKILHDQSAKNEERNIQIARAKQYKALRRTVPDSIQVILGVEDCPSLMFYNKDLQAFESLTAAQLNALEARKVPIGLLMKSQRMQIPAYVQHYPYICKIYQDSY